MARITVEDCLDKVENQYDLVLLAKERTSQLNSGAEMLVEEDNDRPTLFGLLSGSLEYQSDLALCLPHILVEQFGALDVQEITAGLCIVRNLGNLVGERVGDRLSDERLAAARRPVEKDPLGSRQVVLGEQVLVQERQFDCVHD